MLYINISKNFGEKNIFNKFETKFFNGYIYKLSGENGSGKSTLFSLLYKMDKDYEGTIKYNNKNIKKIDDSQWRLNYIEYVSQNETLIPNLTLKENIFLLIQNYSEEKFFELIEEFNFKNLQNEKYSNLSGGEKQCAEIIVSLLKDNDIILLDEVDRNLDKEKILILNRLINKEKANKLIIFVSHFGENIDFDYEINVKEVNVSKKGDKINHKESNNLKRKHKNSFLFKYLVKDKIFLKLILSILILIFLFIQTFIISKTYITFNMYSETWDREKFNNEMIIYCPFVNITENVIVSKDGINDVDNLFFKEEDTNTIKNINGVTEVSQAFIPYVNTNEDSEGFVITEKYDKEIYSTIDENYFLDYDINDLNLDDGKEQFDFSSYYLLESKSVLESTDYFHFSPSGLLYGDMPDDESQEIAVPINYAIQYQYINNDRNLENIIGKEVTLTFKNENNEINEKNFIVSGIVEGNSFVYPYDSKNEEIMRLRKKNYPYINTDKTENYETEYANYQNFVNMINSKYLLNTNEISYDDFVSANPDLIKGFYIKYEEDMESEVYNELIENYPNSLIYSNYSFENGGSTKFLKSYIYDKILKTLILFLINILLICIIFFKYYQENIDRNYKLKFYGYRSCFISIGIILETFEILIIPILFTFLILIISHTLFIQFLAVFLLIIYFILLISIYYINNLIYFRKKKNK